MWGTFPTCRDSHLDWEGDAVASFLPNVTAYFPSFDEVFSPFPGYQNQSFDVSYYSGLIAGMAVYTRFIYGAAAAMVIIVLLAISAYCFRQWKKRGERRAAIKVAENIYDRQVELDLQRWIKEFVENARDDDPKLVKLTCARCNGIAERLLRNHGRVPMWGDQGTAKCLHDGVNQMDFCVMVAMHSVRRVMATGHLEGGGVVEKKPDLKITVEIDEAWSDSEDESEMVKWEKAQKAQSGVPALVTTHLGSGVDTSSDVEEDDQLTACSGASSDGEAVLKDPLQESGVEKVVHHGEVVAQPTASCAENKYRMIPVSAETLELTKTVLESFQVFYRASKGKYKNQARAQVRKQRKINAGKERHAYHLERGNAIKRAYTGSGYERVTSAREDIGRGSDFSNYATVAVSEAAYAAKVLYDEDRDAMDLDQDQASWGMVATEDQRIVEHVKAALRGQVNHWQTIERSGNVVQALRAYAALHDEVSNFALEKNLVIPIGDIIPDALYARAQRTVYADKQAMEEARKKREDRRLAVIQKIAPTQLADNDWLQKHFENIASGAANKAFSWADDADWEAPVAGASLESQMIDYLAKRLRHHIADQMVLEGPATLFNEGIEFTRAPQEVVDPKESHSRMREVVSKLVGPMEPVVEEAAPTTVPKKKGAAQVAKDKATPIVPKSNVVSKVLESAVIGSERVDVRRGVVRLIVPTGPGKAMTYMCCVVKLGERLYASSPRHCGSKGDNDVYTSLPEEFECELHYYDDGIKVLQLVVKKSDIRFEIKGNDGDYTGCDDIMYVPLPHGLPLVAPGYTSHDKVDAGSAVSIVVVVEKNKDGKPEDWVVLSGTVAAVIKRGQGAYIAINISTRGGDCCTPYFDRAGKVIARHRYSELLRGPGQGFPAGDAAFPPTPLGKKKPPPKLRTEDMDISEVQGLKVLGKTFSVPDKLKVLPLKSEAKTLPLYGLVVKPGHKEVRSEIDKFGEEVVHHVPREMMESCFRHVTLTDGMRSGSIYRGYKSAQDLVPVLVKGLDLTSSAGFGCPGNQGDYVRKLGDGDLSLGFLHLAKEVMVLMGLVEAGKVTEKVKWKVFGKEDKYPWKKLEREPPDTRSIQSPTIYFKCLHLAYYAESDDAWTTHCPEYAVGVNMDRPVPISMARKIKKTKTSDGTDAKGWDRYTPADFMEMYFQEYLPCVAIGVPKNVRDFFAENTIRSVLVLADGAIVEKDHGIPSGYPNTLRINSVINRVVTYCAECMFAEKQDIELDLKDVDFECVHLFCGDDMIRFMSDKYSYLTSDAYYAFLKDLFPKWEFKLEGRAEHNGSFEEYLEASPPFISRKFVMQDGVLWMPHHNIMRVMTVMLYHHPDDKDPLVAASRRDGVCDALLHSLAWKHRGILESKLLDNFCRIFDVNTAKYAQRYRKHHIDALYREGTAPPETT